jgi:hypothetical protein
VWRLVWPKYKLDPGTRRSIWKPLRTWPLIWKRPWKRATRPWWPRALGDIARAKGMAHIARETGLGRESLYKALSPEGNPEFATVLKVVRALGLRLRAAPAQT